MNRKVLMVTILMFVLLFNVGYGNVAADSTAGSMGFDVDETQYGDYKSYKQAEAWAYQDGKIVGYGILRTAVYEDKLDSTYAIVIYHMTTEPINVRINWLQTYNSYTDDAKIYSDVDSGGISYGYGYYASSAGFEMLQPSPSPSPSMTAYTVGIEIANEPKVSASVTVEDNELEIDTNHSTSNDIFEVVYEYSCSSLGFDCSYRNDETYNKATFMMICLVLHRPVIEHFTIKLHLQWDLEILIGSLVPII